MLRIKLRYTDVEVMVQRFAANVGKSGLFLPTRSLQPTGAEIKFELRLADDTAVLVGLGRVKATRAPDPRNARAAFGMTVELMRVTPQSRGLILRMLQRRRELGLAEVGLPTAEDIDAARRPGDVVDLASGPVASPVTASGPVPVVAAVPPPSPPPSPPGEALLTAPRRTTGPITVAKVAAIAPLAPELPRKRRAPLAEIIERASGPVATAAPVPGLDDDVDIAATIARARALAGSALDAELDALGEAAAAPVEISIDAASAELARQLGGSPVRRDRSAGWAPPPATTAASAASFAVAVEPPAADLAAAVAADAAPADDAAVAADAAPAHDAADGADAAPTDDAAAATDAAAAVDVAVAEEAIPVAVESASDELAQARAVPDVDPDAFDDGDLDRTPEPLDPPPEPGDDGSDAEAGRADDERVELALAELDSDERTELGGMLGGAAGFALPADVDEPDPEDDLEARFDVDADDADAGDADAGDADAGDAGRDDDAGGYHAGGEAPLELGVDEFDDFEILAEANADDEDLLGAHGEHDASQRRRLHPRAQTAGRRPSELDFASRLDLGDDSDRYAAPSADEFSAHHVIEGLQDELTGVHHSAGPRGELDEAGDDDPHAASAGAALAALETGDDRYSDDAEVTDDPDAHDRRRIVRPIFELEPSSSITLAGVPSDSIELDSPSQRRAEPFEPLRPARGQPEPRASMRPEPRPTGRPEPSLLRNSRLSLHEAPVEDYELEHALEALDVDLDDLSIPHAATQLQRDTVPPPATGRPAASGQPRSPLPTGSQPRMPGSTGSQPRVPVPTGPQPRAAVPTPRPQRVTSPTGPQPRTAIPTPAPQPRAPLATPSRPLRHSDLPGAGRAAVPRAPSEDGVDIDFDDDD